MAILFQYNNPDTNPAPGEQLGYRSLSLRMNPNEVSWTYNLNTATFDTYGGQVVQVLSVNIDTLTISGQLGKEGPFGVYKVGAPQKDDRYGGPVSKGGFSHKFLDRQFDYNGVEYPGLHAMVEFFREYFALVSQGGDWQNPGMFQQVPMYVSYGGATSDPSQSGSNPQRNWTITPTGFPDFRRANDNFAPEWRVVAQVIEADSGIVKDKKSEAINRLNEAIGYKIRNPFSDPNVSLSDLNTQDSKLASQFRALLPQYSKGQIEDMIWKGVSIPGMQNIPGVVDPIQTLVGDIMQGEIELTSGHSGTPGTTTGNAGTARNAAKNPNA